MRDVRLRPLGHDDIPAWNRLLAAVEREDRTGDHYDEDDLAEEMDNPDIEVGKDIVGAFAGEELVGYFAVYPLPEAVDVHKVSLEGSVHPAWRGNGIGSLLAAAMLRRAREAHRERHPRVPARLTLRGLAENHAQARLMAELGLTPERWSFVMRADLRAVTPPPATFPDGFELRRYDESLAGAMLEAHNQAFLDHPNFVPWTESMWKQWVTGSRGFRPRQSFVLLEKGTGRVAAYLQTDEYDAYRAATGRREAYVAKVGTLREHRGRGLASGLLAHALIEYRSDGYDEASLNVDSENPTGALGIYRRAGFEVESRWVDYVAIVSEEPPAAVP